MTQLYNELTKFDQLSTKIEQKFGIIEQKKFTDLRTEIWSSKGHKWNAHTIIRNTNRSKRKTNYCSDCKLQFGNVILYLNGILNVATGKHFEMN